MTQTARGKESQPISTIDLTLVYALCLTCSTITSISSSDEISQNIDNQCYSAILPVLSSTNPKHANIQPCLRKPKCLTDRPWGDSMFKNIIDNPSENRPHGHDNRHNDQPSVVNSARSLVCVRMKLSSCGFPNACKRQ
jgi:hypothetical protein